MYRVNMGRDMKAGILSINMAAVALHMASGAPKAVPKSMTTGDSSVAKRPRPVDMRRLKQPLDRHLEEEDKVSSEEVMGQGNKSIL